MSKRKYMSKENFFLKYSKHSSYILGFIVADGCINKRENTLTININPKDISVLEYIKKHLSPKSKIYIRQRLDSRYPNKIYYISDLSIYSKNLVKSLINFYEAMWIYYKKHFYSKYNSAFNFIVWLGIKAKMILALSMNYFR